MTKAAEEPKLLVYYPGHLGPEPVTRLRGGMRAVRWAPGKVVELPRADALDLIYLQGFNHAQPLAAVVERLGLPASAVRKASRVAGAPGDELVVFDPPTRQALKAAVTETKAAKAAAAAVKKPKPTTPDPSAGDSAAAKE